MLAVGEDKAGKNIRVKQYSHSLEYLEVKREIGENTRAWYRIKLEMRFSTEKAKIKKAK